MSLYDRIFGCAHRHMTRPITPMSRPGVPSGETYVVCLDCGKQFAYDWDHMRLGNPIAPSSDDGVLQPRAPRTPRSTVKYAIVGSFIPLGILLGAAVLKGVRNRSSNLGSGGRGQKATVPPGKLAPAAEQGGSDERIALPHGGSGASFGVRELVDHIRQSGRDYIVQGQIDCALADHPKPSSLDYWLREHYARNKDVKQATNEVIASLTATGVFEEVPDLACPDSGKECKGVRLTRR